MGVCLVDDRWGPTSGPTSWGFCDAASGTLSCNWERKKKLSGDDLEVAHTSVSVSLQVPDADGATTDYVYI